MLNTCSVSVHLKFHLSLPLLLIFFAGLSIECYQCNSAYDPRCGDPFDSYSLGQVNCSMKPPLEHLTQLKATMCRKIIQKVNGKIRVVRGCGYVSDISSRSCIQRSGTHDVQVQYCSCKGDLCNTGARQLPISNSHHILLAVTCLATTSLLRKLADIL
ncbi:hypothetical protein B7P43_G06131 [Cryptotermes secundus]|uniref:Uncharacterized protein n=1 Tax=Cryptotermes secundus TaxID=105785 RepID=A0A2J7QPS6_9NEOP|nr:hypothetical protein B7P43_G06131 [Cryptotermes secundus]